MPFPRMLRLRQKFDCPRIDDIPDEVERQLLALNLGDKVKPGQSVAVTVGSPAARPSDCSSWALVPRKKYQWRHAPGVDGGGVQ